MGLAAAQEELLMLNAISPTAPVLGNNGHYPLNTDLAAENMTFDAASVLPFGQL